MPQQFSSYKHRRDLNQTQKISAEKEKKRKKNLPLPLRASVEKPLSCSGHFLLDRSQREQLSMRVTHMIDSLLCQGPAGPFEHGDIHLEPPPPLVLLYNLYPLSSPKSKAVRVRVIFTPRPIAGEPREGCGATSFWKKKTNKRRNTTEPSPWGGLEMDYLSLNTHTPFPLSPSLSPLFSFLSRHLLFSDPNYKSQLEGER